MRTPNDRLFAPLFLVACLLSLPPSATAQSASGGAYTDKDIIARFAPLALGATRGLCIGSEAECPAVAGSASNPSPVFDLVVTFDHDSARLTDDAKRNLIQFAKALRNERLRTLTFLVEGHTDAKGGDAYNLDLSSRRAQAVVEYLVSLGVDSRQVTAKGYGKSRPSTADPFDPANRRVETRVNAGAAHASR
jgi:outer membrane protein OmpA-like peptidoglycan-associated protein